MSFSNAVKAVQTWWKQKIVIRFHAWKERLIASVQNWWKKQVSTLHVWKKQFIAFYMSLRKHLSRQLKPYRKTVVNTVAEKKFIVCWWINATHTDNSKMFSCKKLLNDTSSTMTFLGLDSQLDVQKSSPLVKKVVEALFSVSGIEMVSLGRFQVAVTKTKVFSWKEIILGVNIAMTKVFGYKPDDIEDITDLSVRESLTL